jgi:hypothetical protein
MLVVVAKNCRDREKETDSADKLATSNFARSNVAGASDIFELFL